MILLAGFLDVMLRSFSFIGLALGVGGILFRWFVLSPAARALPGDLTARALRRNATIIAVGAFAACLCEMGALIVGPWSLADETGRWPLADYLQTDFAHHAIVQVIVAGVFGVATLVLRARTRSAVASAAVGLLALATMASGGPLTHGASRLLNPVLLMTVTVLHQLPAVVWVGGTIQLVAAWLLIRRSPDAGRLWPALMARFSPLALACVAALLIAGLYLAWHYVTSLTGLVGTAYGTMLLTKIALMLAALLLGFANMRAIGAWKRGGGVAAMLARTPVFVEVEAGIGICILMAAAAFTGQPPSVDMQSEWATPRETAHTFAPKVPQLTPPPFKEMERQSTLALDPYSLPTDIEKVQSNFNHNVSGSFVLLAGLGALLFHGFKIQWARHWPLAFLPLALLILIYGEPTVWPLGKEGVFETLQNPEVLFHRIAFFLAVALALAEWQVATGRLAKTWLRWIFPGICFVGGALMLGHSHSIFVAKWTFLIEVSHNALAVLAVLIWAGRWLELRLPTRTEGRIGAAVWPVCLALVGLVLMFYRET